MNEIFADLAARADGKIELIAAGADGAGKSSFVRLFSRDCFPFRASVSEKDGCEIAECAGENGFSLRLREYKGGGLVGCTGVFLIVRGDIGTDEEPSLGVEEGVLREISSSGKPFIILLNSKRPQSDFALQSCAALSEKYGAAAFAADLQEGDLSFAARELLSSFPLRSIEMELPDWLHVLPENSRMASEILCRVREIVPEIGCMRDCDKLERAFAEGDVYCASVAADLASGAVRYVLDAKDGVFYRVLSEECGAEIADDLQLMSYVSDLGKAKRFYDRYYNAFAEAEEVGYGITVPTENDLTLGEPEMFRKGTRCGVRLKADAPTYHVIRVDVHSEVNPVMGDGARGEEIAKGVMNSYEQDAEALWNTDMFGRTFKDMVRAGLDEKRIPDDACGKLRKALTRIVNEGKGGVLCILL